VTTQEVHQPPPPPPAARTTRRPRDAEARGIKFVPAPPEIASEFETIGKKARQLLVGTLYSQEFLGDVERSLAEYRAEHPAPR
jgi:hypothetical protein